MAIVIKPSVLPQFSFPACDWAQSVRRVIRSYGAQTDDAATQLQVLPVLTGRVPVDILEAIPEDASLEQFLKAVEKYDERRANPLEILKTVTETTTRPSIHNARLTKQLRVTLTDGVTADALKELVWLAQRKTLSTSLQTYVQMADIRAFPTTEQLQRLDELFLENQDSNASMLAAHVATSSAAADRRVSALEEQIRQMHLKLEEREQPASSSTNVSSASNSINAVEQNRAQFQRNVVAAGRTMLPPPQPKQLPEGVIGVCKYHVTYGNAANLCVPPCLCREEWARRKGITPQAGVQQHRPLN